MAVSYVKKSATDVIDYQVDYTNWLADGDTLASAVVTVPAGITLVSSANDTTAVTARLSGGTDGERYEVPCQATLADGQKKTHVINVTIGD
jgi:hypothetical protein